MARVIGDMDVFNLFRMRHETKLRYTDIKLRADICNPHDILRRNTPAGE